MTVETRWSGVTVTDWLEGRCRTAMLPGRRLADPGGSTLVRVLSGSGVARLEFAPRPEFGQVSIRLQPLGDGLLVLGYNEPITLFAPGVEWDVFEEGGHDTARAVVDLSAAGGERVRSSCGSTRTTSIRTPIRSTTGRRGPSSRRATGSRGSGSPTSPRRRSCAAH